MSIDQEEHLVNVTAYYYTNPTVINVPAHSSPDEIREAINSAIGTQPEGAGPLLIFGCHGGEFI